MIVVAVILVVFMFLTAMKETLERSNLGLLKVGDKVNVERSMMMNGRLDGDPWDLVITPRWIKKALPIYSVLTLSATGSEMESNIIFIRLAIWQLER